MARPEEYGGYQPPWSSGSSQTPAPWSVPDTGWGPGPGQQNADTLKQQHPDWPMTPWGVPYDPSVGYNTGVAGPNNGGGYLPTGTVTPGQAMPGGWNPPTLPKIGIPSGEMPPADPSTWPTPAAPTVPTAPKSPYGPYLGWDQGKLNDPTHNTPKYQFLRAMLDAGIDPAQRDKGAVLAALKAKGYDVSDVAGSSDQIRWGNEGTYDVFNGTNNQFLFGQTTNPDGSRFIPPWEQQPGTPTTAPGSAPTTGAYGAYTPPYLANDPMTGSSYGQTPAAPTLADVMKPTPTPARKPVNPYGAF